MESLSWLGFKYYHSVCAFLFVFHNFSANVCACQVWTQSHLSDSIFIPPDWPRLRPGLFSQVSLSPPPRPVPHCSTLLHMMEILIWTCPDSGAITSNVVWSTLYIEGSILGGRKVFRFLFEQLAIDARQCLFLLKNILDWLFCKVVCKKVKLLPLRDIVVKTLPCSFARSLFWHH